jgi:secondary thiamine-phosphate synthase enzyme
MVVYKSFTLLTKKYNQLILVTEEMVRAVRESGIKNGLVTVITKHTTTGITVNEALECLESDIEVFLEKLVPEDYPYSHARMLKSYGSTAGNPTGHLKAHITGNHCSFPIVEGEIIRGDAQEVYFCEFDGPAKRTVSISIIGE